MSNTEENALFQAILAAPEDDTVRLIYADWLEEHGERDRAEFIRLEILEQELDPYSVLADNTRERIGTLRSTCRSRWLAELPEWAAGLVQFRRGLPAHLWISVASFLESAEELAQLMPLESASIRIQNADDIAPLVRHPALGRLRELTFDPYRKLGAESMRLLASSPYLTRLRKLDLGCQTIGGKGAAYLARADLPALRELELFSTELDSEGLQALASAPWMKTLTKLRLGSNPIGSGQLVFLTKMSALEVLHLDSLKLGDEDMETLAASPLTRLRELDLTENEVHAQGLTALAQSPHLSSLARLELYQNPLGEGGGEALASSSFRLRSLEITSVGLGDVGLARFIQSDRVNLLTNLNVESNDLTESSAQAIVRSEHLGQLRTLRIGENAIGSNGALALISAPSLPALEYLDLDRSNIESLPSVDCPVTPGRNNPLRTLRVAHNGICGPLAKCLFTRPELAQLKSLAVFDNPLSPEGMEVIATSPVLTNLKRLHASNTALGDEGARRLAESPTLRQLQDLWLVDCGIGDEGVAGLADSPVLATVDMLDLSRNSIELLGVEALAASRQLGRLQSLRLDGNPLRDAGGEALAQAIWLDQLLVLSLGRCRLGERTAWALLSVPYPGLGRLRHLDLNGNSAGLADLESELRERFGTAVRG